MPEFLPFSYFFSSSWSMRDKLVHKHLDFFPAVPVIMVPFTTNSSAIVDKFGIRMSWCPGCGELSSQVGVGTVFVPPSTWFAYSAMWAWFILVLVPGRRWVNMFCLWTLNITLWRTSSHCHVSWSPQYWRGHCWTFPLSACNHLLVDQPGSEIHKS